MQCAEDCENLLKEFLKTTPTLLKGNLLNQVNVDIQLEMKGDVNFIFAAYSHGVEDALKVDGNPYVKVDVNTHLFKKGLVYTNACLSAQELGHDLVENGAFAFVGYNEEVPVWEDEVFKEILKNVDNYALALFLSGQTIGDAVNSAKKYISNIIALTEPYKYKTGFVNISNVYKAELKEMREAMDIIGNKNLTIHDLIT
jgi:hypothetical protein